MKIVLLTHLLVCFCSVNSFSQNDLSIKITNLRSNKGRVLLYCFDKKKNNVEVASSNIVNNECEISIYNLSAGQYAFKYFHDENNNGTLDCNWMKIPKEGYGFSNNAKGAYGPPSFEKWLFEIKDNTKIICYPKY